MTNPKDAQVLGAELHPDRASVGWDFWWRSAAGDVVAVFGGFGAGGDSGLFASWVREAMSEPEGTSLEARARWPIERAQATALERVTAKGSVIGSMACVAFAAGRAAIAHIGEARVYAVTSAGLERLTRDHMLSVLRPPELEDMRLAHPDLDFMLRSIGHEERFAIEVSERALVPGEALALCTPKVWKTAGDELGKWLVWPLATPAEIVQARMERLVPRLPAALAMVFSSPAEVPRPPPMVWPEPDSLVILYAPNEALERRRYPLGPGVTTLGRGEGNDIVIDDDSISRRHARFERRESGWWIVDESTNGTLVNQKRVREAQLRLDDHVDVGRVMLLLIRSDIPFEIVEPWDHAPIDGLTGAHSKRVLREQIGQELDSARSSQRPLSLLRLDIARFKQLNDTFGHPAGDEVLRALAGLLRRQLRPGDVLARYTGDEFAVLMPGMDREGATAFAETLRAEIAALAVDAAGTVIQGLAVWVGVAQANEGTRTADDSVHAASPTQARRAQGGGRK